MTAKHLLPIFLAAGCLLLGCGPKESAPGPRFELVDRGGFLHNLPTQRRYDLYLVLADGNRKQLSRSRTGPQGMLVVGSLAIWTEWSLAGVGAFEDLWDSTLKAGDTSGHVAEISGWLAARALRELPNADPYSLAATDSPRAPAAPGGTPSPRPPPSWDPRAGVRDFRPKNIALNAKAPPVTFWCTVAAGGAYRPLAMRVPPEELLALLAAPQNPTNQNGF